MRKAVTLPPISRTTNASAASSNSTATTSTLEQSPSTPKNVSLNKPPTLSTIGLYRSVTIANFGAFLVGMHFALFSGILETSHFAKTIGKHVDDVVLPVSSMTKSLVTAAYIAMMALAAPFCGPLVDYVGRRASLHAIAALFAISSIFTLFAKSVLHIILTRLFAGLGYAIANIAIPLYTTEISPPSRRGQLVNLYCVMLGLGILFAQIANIFLAHAQWTYPVAFSVVPALLMLFGVFIGVPESPVWQALKNNSLSPSVPKSINATANSLSKREKENITSYDNLDFNNFDDDSTSMPTNKDTNARTNIDIESNPSASSTSNQKGNKKAPTNLIGVLRDPSSRYRLGIGVFLAISQQLSGINAVFFFAPTIVNDVLQLTGTDASLRAAAAVGAANVVSCILATFVVELAGRRTLLLAGAPPMAVSLAIMGAMRDGFIPKQAALGLGCLLVYVAVFSITLGPIPFVICSEIFPPRCSGTCLAVCMGAFGLASSAIGMSFLFVFQAIGGGVFYIFSSCLAITEVFVWFVVPETKGLTLQQIDQLLDGKTTG